MTADRKQVETPEEIADRIVNKISELLRNNGLGMMAGLPLNLNHEIAKAIEIERTQVQEAEKAIAWQIVNGYCDAGMSFDNLQRLERDIARALTVERAQVRELVKACNKLLI